MSRGLAARAEYQPLSQAGRIGLLGPGTALALGVVVNLPPGFVRGLGRFVASNFRLLFGLFLLCWMGTGA